MLTKHLLLKNDLMDITKLVQVIELHVVQFWSEIILTSNRTCTKMLVPFRNNAYDFIQGKLH